VIAKHNHRMDIQRVHQAQGLERAHGERGGRLYLLDFCR
jgi:hypothetical protein